MQIRWVLISTLIFMGSCASKQQSSLPDFSPIEVIDLGTLITEDVAQRVAGSAFLEANGINRLNTFDVVSWTATIGGGSVSGSNAFYTLANHGGPHVDAPIHVGLGGGIDSYQIEAFAGPLKVLDVREYPKGFTVPIQVFEHSDIEPGDIVLIYKIGRAHV